MKLHNSPAASVAEDNTNAVNKIGTDATIYIDPTHPGEVSTTKGLQPTPPEVVLGHELLHSIDQMEGTDQTHNRPLTGISYGEYRARQIENTRFRVPMELPLRVPDSLRMRPHGPYRE